MSASVETMVSCVVVVPAWVIATGVSGDRPAATSASAISAMCGSAESRTSVSWSAYDAQSTLGADAATTANSRWSLLVTGMPAYAGTAVAAETPGTTSKPTPALTTGLRLLGAGAVDERVAGHQAYDAAAGLGRRQHHLRAGRVGQRRAVVAEAAVDELGAGCVTH